MRKITKIILIIALALMSNISFSAYVPGQAPNDVNVAGQILSPTAPSTLIVLNASAGSAAFTTFYKMDSTGSTPAAYQVTTGKTFIMRAMKWNCTGTSAAKGVALVYGDTSVSDSGAGPTSYKGAISQSSGSVSVQDQFASLADKINYSETSFYVPIPAQKYPAIFAPSGLSCQVIAYGYEQ